MVKVTQRKNSAQNFSPSFLSEFLAQTQTKESTDYQTTFLTLNVFEKPLSNVAASQGSEFWLDFIVRPIVQNSCCCVEDGVLFQVYAHIRDILGTHMAQRIVNENLQSCMSLMCVYNVCSYLMVHITQNYGLQRFQRHVARPYMTKTRFC